MRKIYLLLLLLVTGVIANAQNDCATAIAIPSLPFSSGTQTTCGTVGDYNAGSYFNGSYGGTTSTAGEDFVYSITITNAPVLVNVALGGAATWKIASVHSACPPTSGNAIGGVVTTSSATGSGLVTFPTNGTYYIFIDTWPTPNCGVFTLNLTEIPPCAAPTAQPTGLNFTSGATSISGSFTAASPAADNYLVVRTQGVPLNTDPVSGTTYSAGNSLGNGTIVSYGTTTSFNSTGLSVNTNYTYTVFSATSATAGVCSGPTYNIVSPLSASYSTSAIVSIASGNWSDGSTWSSGIAPIASDEVVISAGHTVSVANAGNLSGALTVAGTLSVAAGGELTIGAAGGDNKSLSVQNGGSLSVSDGNLNINGNLFVARGANFSQSGGTISVDGNGTNSVASGTPIVGIGTSAESYNTGTLSLTGGTLIIVDPHTATTNTNGYALYGYLATNSFNATNNHTLQFGDGASTASGGHTSGFYWNLYASISTRLNLGNVVSNTGSGTNRLVTQTGTNVINGNLIVNSGTFSQGSSTTYVGRDLNVTGGLYLAGGTTYFGTANGTTAAAQTVAQSVSVSGSGTIQNLLTSPTANFTSVTINNTSATGVTFNDLNDISGGLTNATAISGTLNFVAGYASAPSGTTIVHGTPVPALGTLSYTSGGFLPGTSYGRWFTNTGTGSLTAVAGRYPFVDATGKNRQFHMTKSTGAGTVGLYVATYTDGSGLSNVSFVDGAYTVDRQYNGYWSFSTPLSSPTATHTISLTAQDAYAASVTNSRVTLAAAAAAGTHTAGALNPLMAQRTGTGITTALLTGNSYYLGINNADIAAAPNCTTNSSPVDAATNVNRPVALSWTAAPTATNYDVYIGASAGTATFIANVTGTTYSYTGASGGSTYYWYVVPKNPTGSATGCDANATSFTTATPPVNDDCSGAIEATVTPVMYNNSGASQSQTAEQCGSFTGNADDDVWYKVTTDNAGGAVTINADPDASLDLVLHVYSGNCGSLTNIGCSDLASATATETFTIPAAAPNTTYYFRVYSYGNAAYGDYAVSVSGAVLPVTIAQFNGTRVDNVNKLTWTTKTEVNNAGFELQRSADGRNFTKLGYVAAKSENGNSTRELNYSFNDTKPYAGVSYYRLNQIDKDGKSTLSNVVAIKGDKLNEVQFSAVYPNPAKDRLNVVLASPKAERVTLVVTDLSGKVIKQQIHNAIEGNNNIEVNVNSLSAGTYIIKLVCASGCETAVQKFMKN